MICNDFYIKSRVTSPDFSSIYWPSVLSQFQLFHSCPGVWAGAPDRCCVRVTQNVAAKPALTDRCRSLRQWEWGWLLPEPEHHKERDKVGVTTRVWPALFPRSGLSMSSACSLTPFLCLLPACALRTQRSKKQQSSSGGLSLSLSQAATPRKTLSFSTVNTPVNSGIFEESGTVTDAALLTSLDQSRLRQRTVTTATTFSCLDGHSGELWKTWYNLSKFNKTGLTGRAALPQGAESVLTTDQVSTATHQNPTPPPSTVTCAKTALFTLRRLIPSSPSQHHLLHHLSWHKLPLTFYPRPHRRLSQVYTPETEVKGERPVRNCWAALPHVDFIHRCLLNIWTCRYKSGCGCVSVRCPEVNMQHMCPVQQTEPDTFCVPGHHHLQQCGLAWFAGPGLDWER